MASEKNAAELYLEEKNAHFGAGFREALGMGEKFTNGPGMFDAATTLAGKGITGAAIGAAGGAAVSLTTLGIQKLYDAATKTRDFNSMLEYDPEIAAMHQENPRRVNQMFSTLRMFNPDFTKDPVVAGHYVKTMAGDPSHAGETAVSALDYASKIRHPLSENVFRAAAGGGGGKKNKK
jgi:hypothetical protein